MWGIDMKIFLTLLCWLALVVPCNGGMMLIAGRPIASSPDVTAPEVSSATINDTAVVINFTEAATQGANYLDTYWNIDGTTMGADVGLTYVSGDGTASWTMTAATGAISGETVNLDFVPGATADIVEDAAGNDLAAITSAAVTNNTSGAEWVTVVDNTSTMTSQWTDSAPRNWRLIIPASTAASSGTKVRFTFAASSTTAGAISGCSIGVSPTNDDFTSAPTRITFSSSNTASVTADTTLVSDEIDFTFDKDSRHIIQIYSLDRNFKYASSITGQYYSLDGEVDYTETQTVAFSTGGNWAAITKVEIYVP